MVEEVLKKCEESLNCSICLDTYKDPRLLRCFHAYCQVCLESLRDQQKQLGLTCPACRQVTPIPDRGMEGLQTAFHINCLLEIQDSVRKLGLEGAVGGIAADTSRKVRHCLEHPEEQLKLYCESCGELVCYECVLRTGMHNHHNYSIPVHTEDSESRQMSPSTPSVV